MSASIQSYYNCLVRVDHPVFFKDFSLVGDIDGDSPFESIYTLIFANRLMEARAALDSMIQNSFPNTVNAQGIDDWENEYFGYTKDSLPLATRISQLLIKYVNQIRMNAPSVLFVAEAITGQTPELIRHLSVEGWILGVSSIGVNTILSGDEDEAAGTYILIFSAPLSSAQLIALEKELSQIQKGGSAFSIISPQVKWILGQSSLSLDTVL